jgi:hypothetical protein
MKILKSKLFLVSFGLSLWAVLVIFMCIIFITQNIYEDSLQEDLSGDDVSLTISIPVNDDRIHEENEFPFPTQRSILTGLRIYEGYAVRRPLAVVINNIRASLPQSGISSADIIYEMLAEGDVTRLVAIFQSHFPEKIGSVRSAREYFIDFAFNHDAIFIYHGGSPSGYGRIRSTGITNMDGGSLEGRTFWRDTSNPEWAANRGTRSREHSSYTGGEQILSHLEAQEIRTYIGDDPAFGFNFGEIPEYIKNESLGYAYNIIVPFSANYRRTFIFDEETELYHAENRDGAHLDAETAEQVTVTNVLIQLASVSVVAGDTEGRRNIRTVGGGRGYLATGGEYFPVLWEKENIASPTRWFFEDGTPMMLSPGRTWVCVFQASGKVTVEGKFQLEE